MTDEEIKTKMADVKARLTQHDAARKLIEAEGVYLRHLCPHTKAKEWESTDYSGHYDQHWKCLACGKEKCNGKEVKDIVTK